MEKNTTIEENTTIHSHAHATHTSSKILSPLTAAVITVSDKGYRGERKDLGGPLTAQILKENGYQMCRRVLYRLCGNHRRHRHFVA